MSRKKITKEEFIRRATLLHGDRYDYSNVLIEPAVNKIEIFCKSCNEFFTQDLYQHLYKNGCPKCSLREKSSRRRWTNEQFIEKATGVHGNRYDYSKTEYKSYGIKVAIVCEKHGEFLQRPSNHLSGSGCPNCFNETNTYNQELFIRKANAVHNGFYSYECVDYRGAHKSVEITCPKHGKFRQIATTHLAGCGCPTCKLSKGELRVERFLKENGLFYKRQYRFKDCKYKYTLPFDFAVFEDEEKTKLRCLIEFDGRHHFEPFKKFKMSNADLIKVQERDNIKSQYCKDRNLQLLRIRYDENIRDALFKTFS